MGVGIIVVRKLTTGTEQFLLCGACIVTYSLTFPFYFISFLFFFLLFFFCPRYPLVASS